MRKNCFLSKEKREKNYVGGVFGSSFDVIWLWYVMCVCVCLCVCLCACTLSVDMCIGLAYFSLLLSICVQSRAIISDAEKCPKALNERRTFVTISSVMTYANTV